MTAIMVSLILENAKLDGTPQLQDELTILTIQWIGNGIEQFVQVAYNLNVTSTGSRRQLPGAATL